jgi:Flp pilus assembly protein TadB
MADDQNVERPRSEPEIIPPGQNDRSRDRIFMRYDDGYGEHRIYIARPGAGSAVFAFLILGTIVLVVGLLIAGVLLLWLPILIGGVLLALLFGPVRYHWRRLQDWLSGRR